MKEPLALLVSDHVSNDLTELLLSLLSEARAGRLTGLAYVAMLGAEGYLADTAGEARRSPTFTRGALQSLDDKLSRRIQDQMKFRRMGLQQ